MILCVTYIDKFDIDIDFVSFHKIYKGCTLCYWMIT